jgi:hypothetical protein
MDALSVGIFRARVDGKKVITWNSMKRDGKHEKREWIGMMI